MDMVKLVNSTNPNFKLELTLYVTVYRPPYLQPIEQNRPYIIIILWGQSQTKIYVKRNQ